MSYFLLNINELHTVGANVRDILARSCTFLISSLLKP